MSQLSNLEDEPRDLALSKNEPLCVWSLLLNGTILGFDPETREKVAKVTHHTHTRKKIKIISSLH